MGVVARGAVYGGTTTDDADANGGMDLDDPADMAMSGMAADSAESWEERSTGPLDTLYPTSPPSSPRAKPREPAPRW